MFDLHFDLLTLAYRSYLENDYTFLKEWIKAYHKDNVKGVIANLYFMSEEEMKKEIHPLYYQKEIPVTEMFRIAKTLVEKLLPNTEIIYSMEGCDYLKIEELEILKEMGLQNILLVWNEKNRYASGIRSEDGLTKEGKKLIDKILELHLTLDLSHTNKKSFLDILNYLQEKNENPFLLISHSNARVLCDRKRNLDEEELSLLTNFDCLVGVFSNRNFVVSEERKNQATKKEQRKTYIDHINHIVSILGIDRVGVSSDDMTFCKEKEKEYSKTSIYDYSHIRRDLKKDLEKYYTEQEIHKILYDNAKRKLKKYL